MVIPTPRPDCILWWHQYPGLTVNYGDTHTQAGLYTMVKLHTQARPYTMVIPASWPNPYYGDNPPPGWTIYYGDNFTHRLGHISWQHSVVQPDPHWPIRYSQLSTPAGHKIWPNQVHGLTEYDNPNGDRESPAYQHAHLYNLMSSNAMAVSPSQESTKCSAGGTVTRLEVISESSDLVEAIPIYVEELLLQLTCWVECTTWDDSGSWSRAVILYKGWTLFIYNKHCDTWLWHVTCDM